MTTNDKRNVMIVLASIFLAFLLLFLILLNSYEKQVRTNTEAVALQSDDVKTDNGSRRVAILCEENLMFITYNGNSIIQVFEPTENNSQSIPKRCNR